MKAEIEANARLFVAALMGGPDPLPLISAAAIAGNAWQENWIRPLTIGPKDHGSDGALQWREGRLRELQRWPGWTTLKTQAKFFKYECKRDYPALWDQLMNPGERSIENLTANICDFYERPSRAGRQIDKRISYAKQVMALYAGPKLPEAVRDVPSTTLGVGCWIAAWLAHKGIILGGSPWVWAVIGVVLVFFIRGRSPRLEPMAQKEEGSDMDAAKVISLIGALVPILEKILADVPAIKDEILQIHSKIVELEGKQATTDESQSSQLTDLLNRLNNLGGH